MVVLRFLQGMSTAETARVLGKTEDAVKKLQARSLQVLKKNLSGAQQSLVAPDAMAGSDRSARPPSPAPA